MLELLFKIIGIFLLVYIIWLFTGGPERGAEREQLGTNTLFIGVDGTPLGDGQESLRNNN